VRNRFQPPAALKQLGDVLQEEWYKIPLETVQNLYQSIHKKDCGYIEQQEIVQHHINKEMRILSVVFLLFCPTSI
jgi:hypothetical protein